MLSENAARLLLGCLEHSDYGHNWHQDQFQKAYAEAERHLRYILVSYELFPDSPRNALEGARKPGNIS